MVEIKTNETHLEHRIKLKRRAFHVLLLRARRDEISTNHLRSNDHELTVTICTHVFH